MIFTEKLIQLRKVNGLSQEELADRLKVSRQAISRWESGSASPDANHLLQISHLFGVTIDYLLNDDYQSDNDLPKVKEVQSNRFRQIMIYLLTLEGMAVFLQLISVFILQNSFFSFLSFLPFIAVIGGFEIAYHKHAPTAVHQAEQFHKKFYKISAWIGLYFPIRFLFTFAVRFYPRPFSAIVLEAIIVLSYFCTALMLHLWITRSNVKQTEES